MSIKQLRTHRVSAPFHTPFVTALRRATTAESLLVEVIDGDGRSGFGEAPQVWQVTGGSVAAAEDCIRQVLGPLLTGRDADDVIGNSRLVQRAVQRNEGAKAAVDVALHDLAARRLGQPLVRFLGGVRTSVPTDVTLAAGGSEALVAAAQDRVREGFRVLKVKVGRHGDDERDAAAADLAQVRAFREAVGPDVVLRLDANQGWTPRRRSVSSVALMTLGSTWSMSSWPSAAVSLRPAPCWTWPRSTTWAHWSAR
jgi:L-alanine-DL-glutamate epimerase-like enolase superfamily enzyme